ncbi:hypothetical protein VPNG_09686 [Cytospora leucostoma]|uniref:Uncharacterized protein n=1 Tax=Cytospora leucostoma TaxID=1230097 RepID=A0A423VJS3_9PEZI|nr:hypothetical protein VPNG_09686 [Cytospora leucostoma]
MTTATITATVTVTVTTTADLAPLFGLLSAAAAPTPASTIWGPKGENIYVNHVHKDGRDILCMLNFAIDDPLFGTPALIYEPDLIAVVISRVIAAHGGDAKALEAI